MEGVTGSRSFLGCAVVLTALALLCWFVFRPSAGEATTFVCSFVILRYVGLGVRLLDRGEVSVFRRPMTRANFMSTAVFFLALTSVPVVLFLVAFGLSSSRGHAAIGQAVSYALVGSGFFLCSTRLGEYKPRPEAAAGAGAAEHP
ncbi:MAG TPA: hypothetical protein VMI31_00990 [Fimbriimonadaceae bacterium]|nr:hypothetical protein [Fimbriimonadaceae bacterium]